MCFFKYHISVDPNVDADSYLLVSMKVDANTEMLLLFQYQRFFFFFNTRKGAFIIENKSQKRLHLAKSQHKYRSTEG
jgi:hypothetical protein